MGKNVYGKLVLISLALFGVYVLYGEFTGTNKIITKLLAKK